MSVRIGTNPIAWSNDDMLELGGDTPLETCLAEAAEAGFVGIEKGNKFPTDPDELKAVLERYGLTFVSGWYSAEALASTDQEHAEQCADRWTPEALEGVGFRIWLDAQNGGLSINPQFAHVSQGCADTATLNAEEMRRFGVSPTIIDAVATAHAAGSWAPKDD